MQNIVNRIRILNRVNNVVFNKSKFFLSLEMFDIASVTRQEIIKSCNFIVSAQKKFTQVRSKKTAAPRKASPPPPA